MTAQPAKSTALMQLLQVRSGLILHQAVYAAANLGLADLLEQGVNTSAKLASELKVDEDALYRLLRALYKSGDLRGGASSSVKNSAFRSCAPKLAPREIENGVAVGCGRAVVG
jgi:hypothetical protein